MSLDLTIAHPTTADGAAMWRIARDSRILDLNSSYSYLLLAHDFSRTSAVARNANGCTIGFVTGYLRPNEPHTLFVWQIAVDGSYKGAGVAGKLLDHIVRTGVKYLDYTISPSNKASKRVFEKFAERRGTEITMKEGFDANAFPEDHEAEEAYRIGPLYHK